MKRIYVVACSHAQFHLWFEGKREEEGMNDNVEIHPFVPGISPLLLIGMCFHGDDIVFLRGWRERHRSDFVAELISRLRYERGLEV